MTSPGEGRPPLPPSTARAGTGSGTWDRVQSLFHEALELDPADREAFVSKIAETQPELAQELRTLLSAYEASDDFLDTPPPGASIAHSALPGDKIGPYRIVEEIGRGGMGVVFRATRDDESFTKQVAIKLIDPGMRSDQILKRFRAERQILAILDHPQIARLLDGGTASDGSPYLVMEYVEGKPLLAFCDDRRLGIDERLSIFLAVCDAVSFAHQRLVVHRDLKSDNILVTEQGSPRLLDFGIAKLLSPEGKAASTVTAPMNRMLTPDYASPEQVRGEPATMAGDVYSLGVVLYELLSGSRPYRFTTRSPEEILRVVTQGEPDLPSTVAARSPAGDAAQRRSDTTRRLRRRLAGDLDYVVLKALEKDPARRYGSADQLAQDLRRHLQGLPVLARGRSTTYLMSRFVRRHRAAVVTTVLVLLSMIAGLAGTTWQASVASRERDRATRRFNEVRGLAHAVLFDIHDAIANLPGSTKARETLIHHALGYLDSLAQEAKGDLSLQRELGLAYAKVGDVQGRPMFPNLGQSSGALQSYDKSLGLLGEVTKAQPDSSSILHDLIVVSQRRSDLLFVMGRPDEAMREALAARERIRSELARRPDDSMFQRDLCVAYGRLVNMKQASADTLGAIEECTAYLALIESMFRANPRDPGGRRGAMIATEKMAELRAMRGDRDSALVFYQRAERLALEAVAALPHNTDASRDLSIVYGAHALFLADGGEIDSALAIYGLGMKIAEDLAAGDPDNALQQVDLASGHYEIGTMLMKGRRFDAAEQRFRDAFERFGRLAAADTGNAETRTFMARSGRRVAEACQGLWKRAGTEADRARWRARTLTWFGRSQDLYRELAQAGELIGEEKAAPEEIGQLVAKLRTGDGPR